MGNILFSARYDILMNCGSEKPDVMKRDLHNQQATALVAMNSHQINRPLWLVNKNEKSATEATFCYGHFILDLAITPKFQRFQIHTELRLPSDGENLYTATKVRNCFFYNSRAKSLAENVTRLDSPPC